MVGFLFVMIGIVFLSYGLQQSRSEHSRDDRLFTARPGIKIVMTVLLGLLLIVTGSVAFLNP